MSRDEPRQVTSGAPYLVPAGLALAAALAAWLSWGRLVSCGQSLESPETQVRQALAQQVRAELTDVYGFRGGGSAELRDVRYEDVTPSVAEGRAVVTAVLSAQGRVRWPRGDAGLAYLGRERFHMKRCAVARWCAEGDQFDGLRRVLLALFRRHDAAARRDGDELAPLVGRAYRERGEDRDAVLRRLAAEQATAPPARVLAWQIRVDREGAEVGEDVELGAAGEPARRARRLYRLAREDERWVFTGGL